MSVHGEPGRTWPVKTTMRIPVLSTSHSFWEVWTMTRILGTEAERLLGLTNKRRMQSQECKRKCLKNILSYYWSTSSFNVFSGGWYSLLQPVMGVFGHRSQPHCPLHNHVFFSNHILTECVAWCISWPAVPSKQLVLGSKRSKPNTCPEAPAIWRYFDKNISISKTRRHLHFG